MVDGRCELATADAFEGVRRTGVLWGGSGFQERIGPMPVVSAAVGTTAARRCGEAGRPSFDATMKAGEGETDRLDMRCAASCGVTVLTAVEPLAREVAVGHADVQGRVVAWNLGVGVNDRSIALHLGKTSEMLSAGILRGASMPSHGDSARWLVPLAYVLKARAASEGGLC